ncbi:MAG TPA: ABC-2 family transporter protein [Dermatophilaceae bacterium]|nr:ABC-2 family transporter protein [Dermatophilaceae bacterium]
MAEPTRGGSLAAYRTILRARMRAQASYRISFATDLLGTLLVGLTELAEVWVIYHNVPLLGGLDFAAALLVFGVTNICFAAADLVVGHLDTVPSLVRAGTIDAFYVRPLSLLGQLVTSDISLRRIGRLTVGIVVLAIAWSAAGVAPTLTNATLLGLALVSGTAIFAGLFTIAAGLQFFLIDGREFTNSFVYGGSYAAQQSSLVYPPPVRVLFTFVVPSAFVGYLPAIALIGLPGGPIADPAWAWWSPLAALAVWVAAALAWRSGTTHYQGGGG